MAKKKINIAVDQQPSQHPPTRLIFLLDRSTSMQRMKEEAVSGFNEYLKGQQAAEGEAKLTLIFFDDKYKVVYDQVNVKQAQPIFAKMGTYHPTFSTAQQDDVLGYEPQGMTSLFDYIHLSISSYQETSLPNQKTIVTILTDGEDTSSKFHSYASVNSLIRKVQDELQWEVMFLGANMNAKAFAQQVGIKLSNVTQFDYSSKGIGDILRTVNIATSYLRGDGLARSFVASAGAAAAGSGDVNMSTLYSTVAESTADDLQTRLDKFKEDKSKLAAKTNDTK
jgi:uncharacterized protein YegL